jgi:hypothetical protein
MDHIRILRRAFEITRFYRALWVFGILLALTTSHGGGGSPGGGGSGTSGSSTSPFPNQFPPFTTPYIPPQVINTLIGVGIALVCVFLLLGIGFAILHYLSLTALVRMVDGYEANGEKVTVRQGFRLGWSRGAFRIWLVDLLFFVIGFTIFILILLVIASPMLLLLTHSTTLSVLGTVITVGLVILVILVLIIVGAAVSLWTQIIRREIILQGRGVMDGIRSGWTILRRHPGDVIIMGLILFGIGLVISILSIPVFFLLAIIGLIAGGLPALLAGGVTSIFAHGVIPAIIAAVVGAPILLVVVIVPLLFLWGLVETYYSSVWTLTYRELLAIEAVRSESPVEPVI